MKFTKDEAYKELVARMTAKGEKLNLSERSVNEQLETLISLIANEEMELTDFVEKVLPVVKTTDANVRNDVSKGIKDYTDKNPYKTDDTQKQTPPKEPDTKTDFEKRLEALEKRNQELELKALTETKKANLRAYLKEKGVANEEWIDLMLTEVAISGETEIEQKGNTLVEMYNKMYANMPNDTTPKGSGGASQDSKLSEKIKAAAELAKAQQLI
jgi:hypothetical protein